MNAVLFVVEGADKGKTFNIEGNQATIGRSRGDIILNDSKISRRHAILSLIDNAYTIVDCNSKNGTYVNENRSERAELYTDDLIRMGDTVLQFGMPVEGTDFLSKVLSSGENMRAHEAAKKAVLPIMVDPEKSDQQSDQMSVLKIIFISAVVIWLGYIAYTSLTNPTPTVAPPPGQSMNAQPGPAAGMPLHKKDSGYPGGR